MKLIQLMLLAGILAVAGCASNSPQIADEDVAVSENTVAKADDDGKVDLRERDDMVCKRYKPTGSHRTKLICQSRAQADAEARRTQDGARRNDMRNNTCVGCGGDG